MTALPSRRYRSAVDRWLLVLLGGALVIAGTSSAIVLAVGDTTARLIAGAVAAVGIGLPAWVVTSTSYTLTATELVVRSGPFRWRRAIADITSIAPTRNPVSSPALSLDRLRIESRGQAPLMISPADRAAFLADLDARRRGSEPPVSR